MKSNCDLIFNILNELTMTVTLIYIKL